MNRLIIFCLFLVSYGCSQMPEPETGNGATILGRWQISLKDRPYNFKIEILEFQADDSLIISLDTNINSSIDLIRKWGYQLKPYLEKEAIFLGLGSNEYEWAFASIKNDTLELDMIRVDTPRIAHYTKIK